MKYKKEGIKSQIEDLKVTEYFFKITGTVVLVGASIALVKENGLTLETNLGDTLSAIGPITSSLIWRSIIRTSTNFQKRSHKLKTKTKSPRNSRTTIYTRRNSKIKKTTFYITVT